MNGTYPGRHGPEGWSDGDVFGPRPYTLTRGRIHASRPLRLETLVQAAPGPAAHRPPLPEHEQILARCEHPRSVAEVSALLGIPLGVIRVLIADLADSGLLQVHEHDDRSASTTMLERVLRGLERL
ncbi:DUF742 domain-containing protein [Streptomyces sp. NPDC089919]|uniref:DUF742 domain-containing protein n=1 Tax=Streptomyces sp. NPDC089919 TaxID=3155188 RepID=UPI00344A2C6D